LRVVGVALVLATTVAAGAAQRNDIQTAINLADKACAASWGKEGEKYGLTWHVDPKRWHARIVDHHWKVWTGEEKRPGLSINVPLYGDKVDADTCDLAFQD
jgi:hypothetical protein